MRNLGFLFLLSLLISSPALAEEKVEAPSAAVAVENVDETNNTQEEETPNISAEQEAEEESPIVVPTDEAVEEVFEEQKEVMPACDDSSLRQNILHKINAYQQENPSTMLIDRRKDALLQKNLNAFVEVPVQGFDSKQDFNVANRLIMTKINRGISEDRLRLCKSSGHGRAGEIYALIYPVGEGYAVDIINFIPEAPNQKSFSFIYTKL